MSVLAEVSPALLREISGVAAPSLGVGSDPLERLIARVIQLALKEALKANVQLELVYEDVLTSIGPEASLFKSERDADSEITNVQLRQLLGLRSVWADLEARQRFEAEMTRRGFHIEIGHSKALLQW